MKEHSTSLLATKLDKNQGLREIAENNPASSITKTLLETKHKMDSAKANEIAYIRTKP